MTARGAQRVHEGVAVGSPPQRERRKVEPGRPAIHPGDERIDILGLEAERQPAV